MELCSNTQFISRQSVTVSSKGMAASSQKLASQIGVDILQKGGNAADAAVAMAAATQLTQPCSTGLGGDAFVLYYDAKNKDVLALNGSGRSASALTLEKANAVSTNERLPKFHAYTVTVPGAAAAWVDTAQRLGRLSLEDTLKPVIQLALDGFAVAPLTAQWWSRGFDMQIRGKRHAHELAIDERGPLAGERFRNPYLANTLSLLAKHGKDVFYKGEIAEKIVKEVQHEGGLLSMQDMASHKSQWVEPISINYKGIRVYECPPNGQGLAALLAMNIFQCLDITGLKQLAPQLLHLQTQAMRLAFADTARYLGDPEFSQIPVNELLSSAYAKKRANLIHRDTYTAVTLGDPFDNGFSGNDTVYFNVVDRDGNACSFINSNFMGFGTGIIPEQCGFTLQNRGHGFLLEEGHPNVLAPAKRPYHTIIPGMAVYDDTKELFGPFGVMGGMMQAQGHFQVLSHMIDFHTDPQAALDFPRFQLEEGEADGTVWLEDSFHTQTVEDIIKRGHDTKVISSAQRYHFGLGQIIHKDKHGRLWGGTDSRGDGCALAQA